MKPKHFFHTKSSGLKRLLCASALLALALPASLLAYTNDDLTVIPTGTVSYTVNTNTDPRRDGVVGPLIVMHAMSVHNTLVWKTNDDTPKMLMFQRHSGYSADEMNNPDIINFMLVNTNPGPGTLLGKTALGNAGNQFNSALRRSFQQLCYGGYNIIHDVSQSVATRMKVDQYLETAQLYDWGHPDAYKYDTANPKYSPGALNNSDGELNIAASKNMGPSRGLYYDMYCPGFCVLEDGRPIFPGGHDMNSQNGNYRIQVFDPDREVYLARPMACMRQFYNKDPKDPYSENFFQSQIDLGIAETNIYFPVGNSLHLDCNPHDLSSIPGVDYSTNYPAIRLMGPIGTVTHPFPVPGDMKYARWYPGCIAIPGNMPMFASVTDGKINVSSTPSQRASRRSASLHRATLQNAGETPLCVPQPGSASAIAPASVDVLRLASIWSYLACASSVSARAAASRWLLAESCWSLISVSWVPTKLFCAL